VVRKRAGFTLYPLIYRPYRKKVKAMKGGKIKVIYCYLEPVISLNVKREKEIV